MGFCPACFGREEKKMTEVLFVLLMTAMACGLLGPFLVLRRLSMTADALSHSVLLGIVLAHLP